MNRLFHLPFSLAVTGFFALNSLAEAQNRYDFPPDTAGVADQALYYETNLGLIERATAEAVDQALEGLRLPPGSDILLHCMTVRDDAWFVEDYIARRLNQQGYNVHTADVAAKEPPPATGPQRTGGNDVPATPGGLAEALGKTRSTAAPDTADTTFADTLSADRPLPPPPGPGQRQQQQQQQQQQPPANPGPRGNATGDEAEELIPVPEGQGLVLTYRLVEFGVSYHDSWRKGFMGPRVVERLASVNLYCRLVSGGPKNVLWVGSGKSERLDIVPKAKLDLLEGRSYPFTKPALRPEPLSRLLEPVLVTGIIAGLVYLFYTNQE